MEFSDSETAWHDVKSDILLLGLCAKDARLDSDTKTIVIDDTDLEQILACAQHLTETAKNFARVRKGEKADLDAVDNSTETCKKCDHLLCNHERKVEEHSDVLKTWCYICDCADIIQ